MTASKSFPWKTLIFLLLLGGGSFLLYDIKQQENGNWQNAKSVRTLKDIGVWEYGEKTLDKAYKGLNWTRERIDEYAPGYIDSANKIMQPYVELTKDLGLVFYNIIETYTMMLSEKFPICIEYYNIYVPYMMESMQNNTKIAVEKSTEYAERGYRYLTTEVFVGKMSPENIQKSVWNAFNTAQHYILDSYQWLYEKIEDQINNIN